MSVEDSSSYEEERKLELKLQELRHEMNVLDSRDDGLMERAYADPQEANERMVAYAERHGETDLFVALREHPELFGEYPRDKARFDDAYEARKELPVTFEEYRKRRNESDDIQRALNTMRRERERADPQREDDLSLRR